MCTALLDRPNGSIIAATSGHDGPVRAVQECSTYTFVPRNTTKLTTRGGTSPDSVEMTLVRERKSTHRLGTRLTLLAIMSQSNSWWSHVYTHAEASSRAITT